MRTQASHCGKPYTVMWETLAACRDPPEPPPVRYLEYIVRYGGVPGGSQHAAYRVTHKWVKLKV